MINIKFYFKKKQKKKSFFLYLKIRIVIVPDRKDDDLNIKENSLRKNGHKNKEITDIPKAIPSSLSKERRLEIIEDILKVLSHQDILDAIRREHAISFQLPK